MKKFINLIFVVLMVLANSCTVEQQSITPDEAREIAVNCSMKLCLADYHLEAIRNIKQQMLIKNYQVIQAGEILDLTKVDMRLQLQWHLREAEQLVEKTGYHRRKEEIQQLKI